MPTDKRKLLQTIRVVVSLLKLVLHPTVLSSKGKPGAEPSTFATWRGVSLYDMSYLLPHLHTGYAVDQGILSEEVRSTPTNGHNRPHYHQ